jgi:RimJ/RimL family protein N-acetyltransferase
MRAAVVKLGDYLWRPMTSSDADANFVVALRNTERFRAMFYNSAPITPETHRRFVDASNKRGDINWLIERDGKPVGISSVYNIDIVNRKAECGRIAALEPKAFQLNWVVSAHVARERLDFNKLYIETLEENQIVARGVERMGMVREALLRHHVVRDGVPLNVLLFTNLRHEWDAMRAQVYQRWGTPQIISWEDDGLN